MIFAIMDYIAVGFVPSPDRASKYIHELLGGSSHGDRDSPLLLRQLVQELAYDKGFRNVVIPLSGGMDSRSILGAALEVYETSAIRCMTVGTEVLHDYVVAARTCKRLGLTHERIDPNALSWDVDRLQQQAGEQYARFGTLIAPDALIMCDAMAARIPAGTAVLSGYLGDAVSGKRLPPDSHQMTPEETVDAFVHNNRIDPKFPPSSEARRKLVEFVEAHAGAISDLPGAALYDLLDLGFRQSHRIKAPTIWAFQSPVTPYEDPRWVAHWLARPPADRLQQSAYRNEMERAFPLVFSDRARAASYKSSRRFLRRIATSILSETNLARLLQFVRSFRSDPVEIHETRGDPRKNASMAATMRSLLDSFDRRGLLNEPFLPKFEGLLTRPTENRAKVCQFIASAELHMRAGNMAAPSDQGRGQMTQADGS